MGSVLVPGQTHNFSVMRIRTILRAGRVIALSLCLLGGMSGCVRTVDEGVDPPSGSGLPSASTGATSSPSSTSAPSTTQLTSTTLPVDFDPYENSSPAVTATGEVTDEWIETPDGRRRHFRLYVPSTYRSVVPTSLLIALHGGLGSSEQFAANSGFDELAEANGFIVVYPDGIRAIPDRPGLQTWNGGYCCGAAANKNVDDVGYMNFLLDVLEERFVIDRERIFAAGHSNGAIMAYRLACELSDRIVAIGVQAGSLGIDDCKPEEPVSVLHIHGLADTNHPIEGGIGTGVSGVEFRSARVAVRTLAELTDCNDEPLIDVAPSQPDLELSTWSNCASGAEVRLITVEGAGHAWMGHAAASELAASLVGEPYPNFDSSRAIWSFLAAHQRS
jgi:polyhydroxybutyrate depolymerase